MRIGTLLLLALIAVPSQAAIPSKQQPRENGCEILDAGLYAPATPPVRHVDENSATGERFEIEDVRFTKQTKLVPLELERGFGIRYKLRGLSKVKDTRITWRIFYPRTIRGKAGWEHSDNWPSVNGELVQHLLYDFAHEFELVAGSWRFHVLVDSKPTCAFTFLVK